MRVSDYIVGELRRAGVEDFFLLTGGGMMFLTDAIASCPLVHPVPCHHEQAAAMAALAYAQYRGGYGACFVTTGCGGTNAVTGVLHAWQDHTPVVFVSGQCNRSEMMAIAKAPVRQIGLQEADIVSIVRSITKYAVTLMDPQETVYHVGKALFLARSGSPGPVWLDVPLDVQEAEIDPGAQRRFDPSEVPVKTWCTPGEIAGVVEALESAERPLVLMGQGVRLAGACQALGSWVEEYGIPVVGTRLGWDGYPSGAPLYIGHVDIRGTRAGNFAVQNADVVLCIGTRLAAITTGYNYDLFARSARQVIAVDIDPDEHNKGTVRIDRVINADAGEFLRALPPLHLKDLRPWVERCRRWKAKWPPCPAPGGEGQRGVSKFAFCRELNRHLRPDSVVTTDAGATTEVPFQALTFTSVRQRYLGSSAQGEMGYALPAAIGASVARGGGEALCIVGDGSFQLNLQELQTIVTQRLNVKIFVWNNDGYATIRAGQKNLFEGRYLGVDPASGTAFPPLCKIARAYGIAYFRAENGGELSACLRDVFSTAQPAICEVLCWREELPVQVKARMRLEDGRRVALPIEDMVPLLPREELEAEMLAEPFRWWEREETR